MAMRVRTREQRKPNHSTVVQEDVLQRSVTSQAEVTGEALPMVHDALDTPGQQLNEETRAFMEPRFGHDFSQVRIHTDEKDSQSAQAVNALAYTVGSDIVFDKGQYAPETSDGKYLLAHELTHVVQQSAGLLTGAPINDGLSISDPSDSMELAASEAASQVMAGQPQVTQVTQTARPQQVGRKSIQRFQAGETGHGGIEEEAFKNVGFTPDETSKIYFGNWLRDFSQLTADPANTKTSILVTQLLDILALGEFGRELTRDDLGTYIPSEHLDNPEGGGTYEDTRLDPAEQKDAWEKLSPEQKAAYEDEQKHIGEIENAAKESGLPEYIEVGKFHAKRKLAEAITLGHSDEGMMAMGNGLHAVEDYYSHSNFVEVAIWDLYKEGKLSREEYNNLVWTPMGNDAATLGGNDPKDPGRPGVITGTYADKNSPVSLVETLCTEAEHGKFEVAFIKGVLMKYGITAQDIVKKAVAAGGDIGGKILGFVGGGIGGAVGAVAGGIKGGVTGGIEGAAEGWKEHSGVSAAWYAVTGFFSGAASGGAEGAREGWSGGKSVGQEVGSAVGEGIGSIVGLVAGLGIDAVIGILGAATILLLFPIVLAARLAMLAAIKTGLADMYVEAKTAKAAQQARREGLGPSHSELAKDAPDHHLFGVASGLAEFVDEDIGAKMKAIWKAQKSGNAETQQSEPVTPETEKSVTDLVDKYVSHPSRDNWWHTRLLELLKK
jgi:hypothetical protein